MMQVIPMWMPVMMPVVEALGCWSRPQSQEASSTGERRQSHPETRREEQSPAAPRRLITGFGHGLSQRNEALGSIPVSVLVVGQQLDLVDERRI